MGGYKQDLYDEIALKIKALGVTKEWYPFSSMDVVKLIPDIFIDFIAYKSSAIGAIMIRDKLTGIAVNSKKSKVDQNFDIAHELIHYWLHPDAASLSLDRPAKSQDRKKEWQANEGAAQLLVPHWDFIPRFLSTAAYVEENYEPVDKIYTDLARHYMVNPVVIDYRIRNLDNEIMQYHDGIPLRDIRLSNNIYIFDKQKKIHIYRSLLDKLKLRNIE